MVFEGLKLFDSYLMVRTVADDSESFCEDDGALGGCRVV